MSKKITDEDIERGVQKVERMNAMFDKAAIPVLFAAALAIFLFGALPKLIRNIKHEEKTPQQVVEYVDELTVYEQRSKFMDELDVNMEKAEAAGYSKMPEEFGTTCILKQYDENTIVAHFYDGNTSYGKLIAEGIEKCAKVEMRIYTSNYSSVIITLDNGETVSAMFNNTAFTADETLTDTDTNERLGVLENISSEKLSEIRGIYDAELEALLADNT